MKALRMSTSAVVVIFTASLLAPRAIESVEPIDGSRAPIASSSLRNLLHRAMLVGASRQAQETQAPPEKSKVIVQLPDGESRETVKKVCGSCHSTDIFARQRHSREIWSSILDSMTSRGMNASDDDLDTVLNYLATNLGPEKKGDSNPTSPQAHRPESN